MIGESHIEEAAFTWVGLDDDERGLIEAYRDAFSGGSTGADFDDIEAELEEARNVFAGRAKDMEDFASNLLEETGELSEIPERLRFYFDYAAYARDLECGGDVKTADIGTGDVWVFWNN